MADMEEMIKEEISRIGGLKERVVFKDVIERLFLSLYETNQEMYRELESRIMDDLVFDGAWSERILWNMTIWGYKSFWTRSGSGEGSIRMWVTIRQSLP